MSVYCQDIKRFTPQGEGLTSVWSAQVRSDVVKDKGLLVQAEVKPGNVIDESNWQKAVC